MTNYENTQPKGLVDGMACEPDEHMRRAIVEKAVALGDGGARLVLNNSFPIVWGGDLGYVSGGITDEFVKQVITPGEFYDRLCKMLKPEPPIRIGGHDVKFDKGEITVCCTTIPNDIVRKIAERLKD